LLKIHREDEMKIERYDKQIKEFEKYREYSE
jgi:hypothetical protein